MGGTESLTGRVAVIGGGITGLAAAVKLQEIAPQVQTTLYESSERLGGVLRTEQRNGWLVEHSADNFLTKLPYGVDFCRKLGIESSLLSTEESRRRALVVSRGKVIRVPEGFLLMSPKAIGPVLSSPVLGWRGKLRMCCEPLVPRRRETTDESVARFAKRRVGREAFERLVQPLLAGIYTADPEKLSMVATMPQFVEQERRYGSLLRAARKTSQSQNESGARYGLFVAPRGGMQEIVAAAAGRLPSGCVRRDSRVTAIRNGDAGWEVQCGQLPAERYDAVVLATPAYAAADILDSCNDRLAQMLRAIEYAGASIVCMGYRVDQIPKLPDGFGFVVPSVEGRPIIAASFSSLKFPGRTPEGYLLVRVFLGGALRPELADLPDDDLVQIAKQQLHELSGISGEPTLTEIARWPRRMPQYHVGHVERVDAIVQEVAKSPGLELAGAAYRGVGVPQCIHSGEQAAERIAKHHTQ